MAALAKLLPERLKAAIRPAYRRIFQGVEQETTTNLAINSFGEFDIAYREGTTDEIIIGNLKTYHLPELVPGYIAKRNDVIINIGAHIGVFVLVASASAPDGTVFAIEASKETYNFLRINTALNNAKNISIHNIAIAEKNGPCTLYFDTGHWGHSITKQLSTRTEIVKGLTLEKFLSENGIERCNLMYLNCEGAEFPILLTSSRETLQKFDTIQADCHTHLWAANTIDDLALHLGSCGFKTSLQESDGGYDRLLARKTVD
jgi:FkbM family methyltransferase